MATRPVDRLLDLELLAPEAGYVNGADVLADGRVTASWYYGPLSDGGANRGAGEAREGTSALSRSVRDSG